MTWLIITSITVVVVAAACWLAWWIGRAGEEIMHQRWEDDQ